MTRSIPSAREFYELKEGNWPRPSRYSGSGHDFIFYISNALHSYVAGKLLLWPGCSTEIPSFCATWNFIAMFVEVCRWNTVSSASLTPFTHSQCVLVRCSLMLFSICVFQLVSSLEIFECFIWQNCLYETWPTLLYAFFWVITRRLDFICRRFGTLCSIFIGR